MQRKRKKYSQIAVICKNMNEICHYIVFNMQSMQNTKNMHKKYTPTKNMHTDSKNLQKKCIK